MSRKHAARGPRECRQFDVCGPHTECGQAWHRKPSCKEWKIFFAASQKNLMQVCCTEIGICSTHFHKNLQYQISRKRVQWKPRWYMRTDGRTDDLTVWYRFTRRACFYGGLTLPAAITCTSNFLQNAWYFADFLKIWIFTTDFCSSTQYQISPKYAYWEPRRNIRTDRQTDRRSSWRR